MISLQLIRFSDGTAVAPTRHEGTNLNYGLHYRQELHRGSLHGLGFLLTLELRAPTIEKPSSMRGSFLSIDGFFLRRGQSVARVVV